MRRTDADHDACLANFQTARAMHDAEVGDVEFFVCLCTQFFHFAQSHRRISFVNQVERAAAFGPFARITIECDRRTAFR